MATRLIVGCGYLGQRVAARWRAAGDDVAAVTRSPQRAAEFERQGLRSIIADVTEPASLAALPNVETVLYAVGFDRTAGHSQREVYVAGLKNVLDAIGLRMPRLIYISSTSVYGQTDGGWIDEDSPCQPIRENGHVCLEAEQTLQSHGAAPRAVILRLAGIYGPGRLPNREALLAGEPLAVPSDGWLNLIHVEDAAAVVLAATEHRSPSSLYCVSDGQPVQRQEYYAEAARWLGAPPPRFVPPAGGSPKASRAEANRRISNARMLVELELKLAFPSYREGLTGLGDSRVAAQE